jgi:hypothetical protein
MDDNELNQIKNKIPDLLSGLLNEDEARELQKRIAEDPQARREFDLYRQSWDRLKEWRDVEPERGYVSRFWTRLAEEKNAPQKWGEGVWALFSSRQLVPVYAAVCLVVVVGVFTLRAMYGVDSESPVASLNEEEIEFVEQIDLVENLDVLEDLEWLDDLEIIESLDNEAV